MENIVNNYIFEFDRGKTELRQRKRGNGHKMTRFILIIIYLKIKKAFINSYTSLFFLSFHCSLTLFWNLRHLFLL